MRKLTFILTVATLAMAAVIIPVGISNIYLALQLGLLFECVSSLFFLCFLIVLCLFELREIIYDIEDTLEEIPGQTEFGGECH